MPSLGPCPFADEGGDRVPPSNGPAALCCNRPYLHSGQQPLCANFVAAFAPVATNAMSAIANPRTFAFM